MRERGGYCTFEMSFVEVGKPGNVTVQEDTQGKVSETATQNELQAKNSFNASLAGAVVSVLRSTLPFTG